MNMTDETHVRRDVQDDQTCHKCGRVGRMVRLVDGDDPTVEIRAFQCLGKACPPAPASAPAPDMTDQVNAGR